MAARNPRSPPYSDGGAPPLPADALYEVLLRVPAKDLCRLRAVCRPWRRLLSDPHFIAAHAGRHPEPLVVIGYSAPLRDGGVICNVVDLTGRNVVDLTGRVVKRVRATGAGRIGLETVSSIHLDFVCTWKGVIMNLRLLNLATGSVYPVPKGLADEHAKYQRYASHFFVEAAFGQIPSTGEFKVVRVLDIHEGQLCEVFTLDDGGNHARWRRKKPPPITVKFGFGKSVAVAVNGIAYFFSDRFAALDCIACFDLETEEWRPSIRGPPTSLANAPGLPDPHFSTGAQSMTAMNGCLVVVHDSSNIIESLIDMDLWFLMDFERGLWVKQHSIKLQLDDWPDLRAAHPLVLNDGRIILVCVAYDMGSLRIYDQKTNVSVHVAEVGHCSAVGLYTGSPLSLSSGAS